MVHVHPNILAPSLLAGDHGNLIESARLVESLSLRWLHVDIMDGHFVPNLTFGPGIVAALDRQTNLFLDVHLMLDNPHLFIEPFAQAGADMITIHTEPDYPVANTLAKIRHMERFAGLAINPDTPVEALLPHLDAVDLILIMTVQPGFGGQGFRHDTLPKIAQVAQWRRERGLRFRLEVDGGVTEETGHLCREAGADTFVAGTAFFAAFDKDAFLRSFPGDPPVTPGTIA
jgi:ribulose-phosphate 3-epimerase